MTISVKQILNIGMGMCLLTGLTFSMEISSNTQAVNIAGKQRMFTQRMLKDYAMIGMKNTFGKPDEDLKKIIDNFDISSNALLTYTKNNSIKESIKKTQALWEPLKKTLLEEATVEKVGQLQEDLEVLLKAANDTTKLFEKESKNTSGTVVNVAGRQRMCHNVWQVYIC